MAKRRLVRPMFAALMLGAAAGRNLEGQSQVERRVDSLFTSRIRPNAPGCAVGIYRDGNVVLTRGYGRANVEDGRPITPSTTFHLGSLSKPFTALAVLMLEQQKRLSLDDDIRRWVPEMPDYGTPIRVRDLLQHTSGLRDYQALETLSGRAVTTMAEFIGLMAGQHAVNFVPGAQHEYSHSDYLVLGLIVERLVGMPFGEYLEREVLTPLGMRGSFVDVGRTSVRKDRAFGHAVSPNGSSVRFPNSRTFGGDNLHASVDDLARWDQHFDQPTVGGAGVLARMLSRPLLASGDTIPYAYGLRLGTYRGLRTISRGGHADGVRTEVMRFPDQRFAVTTLCNGNHLEAWRFSLAVADLYLAAHMTPARPRPRVPAAVAMSPQELARFAGVYAAPDDQLAQSRFEVRNGVLGEVLFHEARDDTLFTVTPAGDGRFVMMGTTGNVGMHTFRSTSPGAPLRLEISWNDGEPTILERLPDSRLWRPSPAQLSEYAGTWFSADLEVVWRLEPRAGQLVLGRRGHPALTLWPLAPDRFERGFGSWLDEFTADLEFHRDNAGKITHFTVSRPPGEESVRALRFDRMP